MLAVHAGRWSETIGATPRCCPVALPDLEKWVSTENVAQFRGQLSDPRDDAHRGQLEGLLARELIKLQAMFPNECFCATPIRRSASR